jgi:hypothetical protein
MPKDKSKNGKKKKGDERDAARDAVEAIRSAFEGAIAMTAGSAQETRERAQGLLDEIGAAAARVRQTIEEVNLLDELRGLRGDLETLARRVSALERHDGEPAEAPASGETPSPTASGETPSPTAAAVKPSARRGAAKASKAAKGKRAAKGAAAGKAAKGKRAAKRTAADTSPGTATAPGAAKGAAKSAKRGAGKRAAKRPPATDTADDAGSGRS